MRDSAGIQIVENRGIPTAGDSLIRWTVASPEVRITSNGEDGHVLFGVEAIRPLEDGRMAIANRGTAEIYFADSLGGITGRIGGRGQGPGEFGVLENLYSCGGDTLVVSERTRMRLFDPDGRFVRQRSLPCHATLGPNEVAGVQRDCSMALLVAREVPSPPFPDEVFRPRMGLYRLTNEGGVELLTTFGGPERVRVDLEELGPAPALLPWGSRPAWAFDGRTLYLGTGSEREIKVLAQDGSVQRLIRWTGEDAPVTSLDRRAFAYDRDEYIRRYPSQARFRLPLDKYRHVPKHRPVYRRMLLDDEGELWVRLYHVLDVIDDPALRASVEAEPQRWLVFAKAGHLRAQVDIPIHLTVHAIRSGRVYSVGYDTLGREQVEVRRLERPAP